MTGAAAPSCCNRCRSPCPQVSQQSRLWHSLLHRLSLHSQPQSLLQHEEVQHFVSQQEVLHGEQQASVHATLATA